MRVVISLYIQLIFLFVDGAVSSAIYYFMVNWCGIQSHHHRASQTFRFMVRLRGRGL